MKVSSFSEKGNRSENEDFVLSKSLNENTSIHIVADGMGGYAHGSLAASTVTNTIVEYIRENLLDNSSFENIIQSAINQSNTSIQKLRTEYNDKMGTTLAGILLFNHQAYCFWLGDVRIYHLRENKILFQSKDHSLVNELVNKGQILTSQEAQQYQHIVTKSVQGNSEELEPEVVPINGLSEYDSFIICSDGVHGVIGSAEMEMMVQSSTDTNSFKEAVKEKCDKKGNDNYSMIILK